MVNKALLVSLSCGHSLVIEKEHITTIVRGSFAYCSKCPNYEERKIKERSWVDPKKIEG